MTPEIISNAILYGLITFAVVMAAVTLIMDGVHRHEARELERKRQADAHRFIDALRRGDTRAQFYAANDAKAVQTMRLRREMGR